MEYRQILLKCLMEAMRKDDKICVLDADLAKPNGTHPLYKEFPDRCFNVGIAEANMAGVAAGLSAYGYKPVIVSFAPFVTRRICDQLAVSLAYAKQNVKIIGTDPGICAEINGGTHMTFEDIAIVRSIPKTVVYDVVDTVQYEQALPQILDYEGVVYIRTPRKTYPEVFEEGYKFELFKADVVKEGSDVTIIASGVMVAEASKALDMLKEEGISAELISINTVKPIDKETILKSVKKTNHVVTCENHNVNGGVYSAVAELLCEEYPVKVSKVGVFDEFGQVGKYAELLKEYNMTASDICKTVKQNLSK